jgi:hypothetical protein
MNRFILETNNMSNRSKNGGYIVVTAMIFLGFFLVVATALISSAVQYNKIEGYNVASSQALHLAEAGIDLAFAELNDDTSYTGQSGLMLGEGEVDISISNIDSTNKYVTATAYVPDSSNPIAEKTVKVKANIGETVISFRYGVQAGSGGFVMGGGSTVNGSIYSNGDIDAISSVITGAAMAANPPSLAVDQANDTPTPISTCTSTSCITFGNSASTEDFAQSFKISSANPLNSIQFYLKKVSTPGNLTVRIVTDNSGVPSATTLMSTTLSASSVTTSFGWVSVTMPSTPVLDPSQTYWIVLDGASNSSRYYIIGANSNGYANGTGKIGKLAGTWNNTSPSGLDGYFKIYLGGGYSMIGGASYATGVYIGTTASDDAWAHTVNGATVSGSLYCQTGSNNNKSCNTSKPDPTPQPMPISDANIEAFKEDAESGGTHSGNYAVNWAGATLGPKKITGNVTVDGGGTLNVAGTLWVQGNLTLSGGGKIKLDSSYGTNSGAIIVDGYVSLTGGSNFAGSGQPGSYPFVITTSACPAAAGCSGNNAIFLSGGAGTVALVAQNGTAQINGGSSLKQVTAKQIVMDGGATLYYDSGLISENFSSGPGGSWQFVPGSYGILP